MQNTSVIRSADFDRLMGRAVLSPEFREALMDDPEQTIADSGLQLTDEELAQVIPALKTARNRLASERFDQIIGNGDLNANWA